LVICNKTGDASGTFEILFYLTTFTFHIRYILHLRKTLFFFIVGDTSSTFLLWILVRVLQMPKIALAIYVSLHVMCVLFLSSINRNINTPTIFHKNENAQYEIPYVYVSDQSGYKKDSTKPYGSFSHFIGKRA